MNKIRLGNYYLGLLMAIPVFTNAQNLDKILEAHFVAMGQEQIMSLRSIFMEVREVDGFGGGKRYQITKKSPNKIRIEGQWQGQVFINAYDGEKAWTIAPWTGVHIAQWMTDRERDLLVMSVGIGSPLFDYKGLGNKLELIGSESIQGDNHYVIRSTMPSGFYVDYLLDKKDHLIHLARIYREDDVNKVEKEIIFKNYKNLGGFSIPFGFENRIGRSGSDVIVDNIVFGQGAPSSIFVKPD
ncbi:MAG: hypothetical protein ABJF04_17570 [Reichenbachiella sp.]|uniref:hypothetical protein n=1 Tax=Reichenbachiella sp. TaxID=2184521 RepID=UPI0032633913